MEKKIYLTACIILIILNLFSLYMVTRELPTREEPIRSEVKLMEEICWYYWYYQNGESLWVKTDDCVYVEENQKERKRENGINSKTT